VLDQKQQSSTPEPAAAIQQTSLPDHNNISDAEPCKGHEWAIKHVWVSGCCLSLASGRLVDAASVVRRTAWMLSEHEGSRPGSKQQEPEQDSKEGSSDSAQQAHDEAVQSAWEKRRQVLEKQLAECRERLQQVSSKHPPVMCRKVSSYE
jgi:hypothetical protein